jgi:hypothetical protein
MNKLSALALGLVAASMLVSSAAAQTGSNSSPADADRMERRCTTGALSPGVTAPCSDDAVYDGPIVVPTVVSPAVRSAAGVDTSNPAAPSNQGNNPSTVPPNVTPNIGNLGATNPASPGNPASLGNPGSLSNTPPSLSNNPPSPSSPANAANTGNSSTTGGTVVAPARPAASTMGGR